MIPAVRQPYKVKQSVMIFVVERKPASAVLYYVIAGCSVVAVLGLLIGVIFYRKYQPPVIVRVLLNPVSLSFLNLNYTVHLI